MKRAGPARPRHRKGARDLAARALILGLLGRLRNGAVIVREGNRRHLCGRPVPGETVPEVVVVSPKVWRAVASDGSAGLGRAWISGWWTCATLDELTTFLRVVMRNLDSIEKPGAFGKRMRLSAVRALTRPGDRSGEAEIERRNIGSHFDLGNEFFALFLDKTMTYSSAIFPSPSTSLEDAQLEKLDRICRKLNLSPANHVVEIGAGWGSFAVHAASRYGCKVTATTISDRQHELASSRVKEAGLEDLVTVLHSDYRELSGSYDCLVSIEMVEALDSHQYDRYFRTCSELLKPGGLMALQSIVVDDRLFESAKRTEDFVKRYVLPGSCIPSVGAILDSVARSSDLRLVALDDIGHHCAETFRRWKQAFVAHGAEMDALGVSEMSQRLFEFYFSYCEAAFAERRLGDVQCILAKPAWRAAGLYRPTS
ncbi:MAG: Cyclopropane-fatty-acyl-phospholipid synthase [Acidimicrobiaceae bacterium]|jgi:cyclopropane-fatty-acyl-phospholipid synthase|nr:Cyclopropane-fatty-acyl-phospholipid synthase [Acidimicrobiaceae bacterium]